MEERQQVLEVHVDDIFHENVVGDELRLQQVFLNVLSNAVKYTQDHGRIRVSLSELRSTSDTIGQYRFICEDNGYGMSQEFLERIFDPFERASDERVDVTQGTGLGMPIARNIVNMMGGDIRVESKENEGSRFTVEFKIKVAREEDSAMVAQSEETRFAMDEKAVLDAFHDKDYSDRRVLLVEDNELNREIATEILQITGVQVETAQNGLNGLDMFLDSAPGYYDIIFMDIRMPVMDGYEAARAIRSSFHVDARTVPIIAMTADAFVEDVAHAHAAGMNRHMAKPINLRELLDVMEEILENNKKKS